MHLCSIEFTASSSSLLQALKCQDHRSFFLIVPHPGHGGSNIINPIEEWHGGRIEIEQEYRFRIEFYHS